MTELSDKELLNKFHNGNKQYAFNLLVRKYQQRVYWHIRHLVLNHEDANDLTQDTFVKAWKHLKDFRQDAQLFTWLYRIATNNAFSFLNKKKKRFFLSFSDTEEQMINTLASDDHFSGDEIELKFQKALLKLPEKQRAVFTMRYYEEVPYEEMSKIMDTSVGALKASYHHAAKKIETLLKND